MSRTDDLARRNLFDELLALRDRQRANTRKSLIVVKGSELPWEINRHGKMRWYMHPNLDDTVIRSLIIYTQEIPPLGQSGKQQTPGGWVIYVWKGKGYTEVNGVRHEWIAGDLINLPILPEGVVIKHVNTDSKEAALLVAAQPNFVHMLGVDLGSAFEQLEDAPDLAQPSRARLPRKAPKSKTLAKARK